MSPDQLQSYIRRHIPVAEFMQVSVRRADPDVVEVEAPLPPNLNVHGTLFGGSATAIALIAAWSLVFLRMRTSSLNGGLVVHRQNTTYHKPVAGAFTVQATFASDNAWGEFVESIGRRQRGRIGVVGALRCEGEVAARLEAEFAAVVQREA